ncbi:MAG TPA: histidine kinase, partial [Ornithinibacter sp.]|nr:histidine kinase [Ornithinibacter sp.]
MITASVVLVALALMGIAWTASGIALAVVGRRPRPATSAAALAVAGAATLAATVLDATEHPQAARQLLVLAWALALPLAVTAYPRLLWRHPVDLVALVTVVGAGTLATLQPDRVEVLEATGIVLGAVVVAHTWWKLERAGAADRRALTWLAVVGAGAGLLGLLITFVAPTEAGGVVAAVAFTLVGPAMVVGSVRPDVVDVRVVVVQVVVVAVALVGYIALFVGLASLLEILLGRSPTVGELALVGGVSTLAVPPLRTALRGVVDELLFGTRSDPLEAATHVADRSAGDPVLALRAVREALALPYAVLRVDGAAVATSGSPTTSTRTLPLTLGTVRVGELEVGLRPGDTALSGPDDHVLGLVTPLLALTARSTALATELQEAREQSVTAIEEERRRLRRDLHDGLGPRLSGIAFTADAARNSVRTDPAGAERLLATLRSETATAIEEIRGLVYAMRPPALDELGLVQAIRQQALALRTPGGAPLRLDLTATDDLPPLTAAVEVAAYRIVVEALTNAVRHSGSDRATVRLCSEGGALVIEVVDGGGRGDGAGPGAGLGRWRAGVGMSGMRERARELGGTLEAGPTPGGGRVV